MEDTRPPKIALYSELEHGTRSHGGQLKRYKDLLKTSMRACDLTLNELENLTADRSSWRSSFKKQLSDFERRRILSLQDKRVQRKTGRQLSPDRGFTCDTCSRVCAVCIKDRSHLSPTNSSVIQRSVVSTAQSNITDNVVIIYCMQYRLQRTLGSTIQHLSMAASNTGDIIPSLKT